VIDWRDRTALPYGGLDEPGPAGRRAHSFPMFGSVKLRQGLRDA
jgi:hypothetical protein